MKKRIHWITETAVMLALLIVLQWLTKPAGQFVTGSCVNAVLAVTVLVAGMSSGITVALLSPLFAYMLKIAPQILTVPAIMAGNVVYVMLLKLLYNKKLWRQAAALAAAAVVKFAVLYLLVVKIICGVAMDALKGQGLKVPAAVLTVNFSWPQLVTALIGGTMALLMVPILKKALRRN